MLLNLKIRNFLEMSLEFQRLKGSLKRSENDIDVMLKVLYDEVVKRRERKRLTFRYSYIYGEKSELCKWEVVLFQPMKF